MTRGATARLFVALDLSAEVRVQLAGWGRRCAASLRAASPPAPGVREAWAPGARSAGRGRGQLRLLEADTLHVTLCFLGSRPTGEIEALGAALARACAESAPLGELALGAPLWLPPRRPRALAVELHDDARGSLGELHDEARGSLGELHETVVRALAEVGDFELDTASARRGAGRGPEHRFRPHITVARMRAGDAPRERLLPATPALSFAARSATLYRSWLTPTAADYESLVRCALAAPNG
ncbi:MAG TPA: 2'-5' RNA ligase family protein [Solirubrobacteraceae bacterium]|jgi:2'-5' RNA ligase